MSTFGNIGQQELYEAVLVAHDSCRSWLKVIQWLGEILAYIAEYMMDEH